MRCPRLLPFRGPELPFTSITFAVPLRFVVLCTFTVAGESSFVCMFDSNSKEAGFSRLRSGEGCRF